MGIFCSSKRLLLLAKGMEAAKLSNHYEKYILNKINKGDTVAPIDTCKRRQEYTFLRLRLVVQQKEHRKINILASKILMGGKLIVFIHA